METKKTKIRALSLFANVGIAETYLDQLGIEAVLANEIDEKRAKFYKHLYPKTEMIVGDITSVNIQDKLIEKSISYKIDLIMASPPCQGMSTAGKKEEFDPRNGLISSVIKIVKKVRPKFVFLENVPEQLQTRVYVNNTMILIPVYIKSELENEYNFSDQILVDTADYEVPQSRQRAIFLLTRKDINFTWQMPRKHHKRITMFDAIGDLPQLDPLVVDVKYEQHLKIFPNYEKKLELAKNISKWHYPPKHVYRQVYALMHTPTGCTAFDNIDSFKPRKKDGNYVKGFKNTYKRQDWDKPAFTITTYNRTIGSQNNVHPGRYLGKDGNGFDVFSDPRVLTVYEIILVSSLPKDWDIPNWASESFVRSVIGEGIPPLFMKKIFMGLFK